VEKLGAGSSTESVEALPQLALELIETHRAGGYAVTAFAASPGPRASGMAGGGLLCSAPSPNPLRESYDLDAAGWAQEQPDVAYRYPCHSPSSASYE
jgi:hypothetical protein